MSSMTYVNYALPESICIGMNYSGLAKRILDDISKPPVTVKVVDKVSYLDEWKVFLKEARSELFK